MPTLVHPRLRPHLAAMQDTTDPRFVIVWDQFGLAEEPLRSPSLGIDQRLPEPIASQLRTLIALHDDTRLVLAPVELRFEPTTGGGHGVLRLVLVDARASSVRWIGEVTSDPAPAFGPAITASIAAKLSALIAP